MRTHLTKANRPGGFTFKRFFVAHDRCGMKVSTDAVLLGAWVSIIGVNRVLDIGTGSGILALMLAQRLADQSIPNFTIDGVELDPEAVAQATENCLNTSWSSSICIHQQDIIEWPRLNPGGRYDLIVSNPPYYQSVASYRNSQRATARHTATLSHQALLLSAAKLITETGELSVVLPADIGKAFIVLAQTMGWYLRSWLQVSERIGRSSHRYLLSLGRQPVSPIMQTLVLREADNCYSTAFCALTREFYLAMD